MCFGRAPPYWACLIWSTPSTGPRNHRTPAAFPAYFLTIASAVLDCNAVQNGRQGASFGSEHVTYFEELFFRGSNIYDQGRAPDAQQSAAIHNQTQLLIDFSPYVVGYAALTQLPS